MMSLITYSSTEPTEVNEEEDGQPINLAISYYEEITDYNIPSGTNSKMTQNY